jgi:hypothetical protein
MTTNLDQITCSGCVDAEYRFGQPKLYLTPIELARLIIVRSRLGDTRSERAAERIATIGPTNRT